MPKKGDQSKKQLLELPEDAFPDSETLQLLTQPKKRPLSELDTGEDPMKIFLHGPGYSKESNPPKISRTSTTSQRAKRSITSSTPQTPNTPKTSQSVVQISNRLFEGKERDLYEFLLSITLNNHPHRTRYCRVSNQILISRCQISKITLPRCKQRLKQHHLLFEVMVRGFQGGNFYLVFLPEEQRTAQKVSVKLETISPYQAPQLTEELILKTLQSHFKESRKFDPTRAGIQQSHPRPDGETGRT